MNATAMVIAGLIIVPAAGLALWAWRAVARVEEDLSSLSRFEGMHFEI